MVLIITITHDIFDHNTKRWVDITYNRYYRYFSAILVMDLFTLLAFFPFFPKEKILCLVFMMNQRENYTAGIRPNKHQHINRYWSEQTAQYVPDHIRSNLSMKRRDPRSSLMTSIHISRLHKERPEGTSKKIQVPTTSRKKQGSATIHSAQKE